jgi:hypothetical protein
LLFTGLTIGFVPNLLAFPSFPEVEFYRSTVGVKVNHSYEKILDSSSASFPPVIARQEGTTGTQRGSRRSRSLPCLSAESQAVLKQVSPAQVGRCLTHNQQRAGLFVANGRRCLLLANVPNWSCLDIALQWCDVISVVTEFMLVRPRATVIALQ